jgi:hypothetical protein
VGELEGMTSSERPRENNIKTDLSEIERDGLNSLNLAQNQLSEWQYLSKDLAPRDYLFATN